VRRTSSPHHSSLTSRSAHPARAPHRENPSVARLSGLGASDRLPRMDDRFVDLEIRYTYLEHQYAELSQTVFEHQKQIEALKRELLALQRRLHDLGEPAANEKPPHY
jgi:uncharacterized coiled-coil protein SlyX